MRSTILFYFSLNRLIRAIFQFFLQVAFYSMEAVQVGHQLSINGSTGGVVIRPTPSIWLKCKNIYGI